jgi:hypothetical protein
MQFTLRLRINDIEFIVRFHERFRRSDLPDHLVLDSPGVLQLTLQRALTMLQLFQLALFHGYDSLHV